MGQMEGPIEAYLDYIALEKGLSAATVENYRRDLRLLMDFARAGGCGFWRDVDDETVLLFLARQQQAGLEASTLARRISALRGFSAFLLRQGFVEQDFCREVLSPRQKRPLPSVLTTAQVRALLELPDDSPLGLRDRTMLEFAYGCGLRASELLGLTVHDVDRGEELVRCWGKGSKERLIPVGAYALSALDDYLAWGRPVLLKTKHTQNLFLNRLGDALSRSGYWRILSAYGQRLGLDVHPHTLRHSAATHMLDNGADLRLVQAFLGHSSIGTTQIYTNLSRSELKSTYLQNHPRFARKGEEGAEK